MYDLDLPSVTLLRIDTHVLDKSKKWFTEACTEGGTALSFEIEERLHQEQTPFQNVEIYSTKSFGTLMVIDGFIMLTERDNFIYHEMLVHPALFSHPNPESVVIAGGGDLRVAARGSQTSWRAEYFTGRNR